MLRTPFGLYLRDCFRVSKAVFMLLPFLYSL
jgi:hypothetical protein